MPLPKISHPTFKILVPSLDKEFRFRPFTVKEEKILLIAQSTGEMKEIFDAILQVINNCAVDEIDVEEMTSFDIDYVFVKLRARSVNNIVKIEYRDAVAEEIIPLEIDLDKVQVRRFEQHDSLKNISIDDEGKMFISMRYPKPEIINKIESADPANAIFGVYKYCIDKIYDEDNVYNLHDGTQTDEEVNEFIESLPPKALAKIQEFLDTMPRLHHVETYKRKDGSEGQLVLQSLSDFFIFR